WQTPFNNAGTLLPTLRASLVVAAMVLLIACANVGNLLLVKSVGRRHEMTVRISLGAGRARLMRQLLTEGLILAILSAAGGFLVAYWSRNLITLQFPPTPAGIVIHLPAHMDFRVLSVSAGVCLLSTLLFGLVPALQAGKIDLAAALKAESGGVVGGRGRAWVRSGLVVVQVSLSFILLVGAGLLLRSFRTVRQTDVGFSADNVLVSSVDMISAGYDGPRIRNFQDQLVERVQALAGVQSMVWSRSVPFSYRSYPSSPVAVDGFETQPGEQPTVDYNEVGAAYFSTMGLPLVSGREFITADNEASEPVAIVNETMVQRFWRGQDPIGKRLRVKGRWLQVIGVARNAKYSSMLETSKPFFYTSLRQGALGGQNFQIRTRLAPTAIAGALAREIKAIDPNLAAGEVITMRENIARRTWSQRAAFTLLAIFACIALLLAAVGLYGVMSYAVSQSRRELGLRMALGATSSDLLRIVMSQAMGLTLAGIAAGVAVALALTRLLGDMLYKISPRDPESFATAFAAMTLAAAAACLLPAWRATQTDPVRALRD
ncbi:MAG TPA: FtsX-like permease family protein, partial [Bryobacteraceae bacterium]|nr:FtsX-like permease family protein [Bryobacteraceae bacterium]